MKWNCKTHPLSTRPLKSATRCSRLSSCLLVDEGLVQDHNQELLIPGGWRAIDQRRCYSTAPCSRRLSLPDWTPERAELARFLSARNLNSLSVRVRIRSTRTDPRGADCRTSKFLFFFSSSFESRRTRCAYESRSAAPLLEKPRIRHGHSQNICYGHEERKVTAGTTQARRARYLLSSWHSHLSNWARQQRRESWCRTTTVYRPPPRTFTITGNGVGTGRVVENARNPPSWNFFSPLPVALLTLKPHPIFPATKQEERVALFSSRVTRQLSTYILIEKKSFSCPIFSSVNTFLQKQ